MFYDFCELRNIRLSVEICDCSLYFFYFGVDLIVNRVGKFIVHSCYILFLLKHDSLQISYFNIQIFNFL